MLPDLPRLDGQDGGASNNISNLQPTTVTSSSPGVIVPPSSAAAVIASSLSAVTAGERTAVGGDNLPDALAPLSPSPDEQLLASDSQVKKFIKRFYVVLCREYSFLEA